TINLSFANTNDLPVNAIPIAATGFSGSGEWRIQIPASTFSDADGDVLSLQAALPDGSSLPDWLSFDPQTGIFSGDPPSDLSNQTLELAVTATDPFEGKVNMVFAVQFGDVNDQPQAIAISDQQFNESGNWQ